MPVLREIKDRRSVLSFAEDDVPTGTIGLLIEAARWAPSGFNNQPWRYVFVHRDDATRARVERALMPGNGWAAAAPWLIVVTASARDQRANNNVPYHIYDSALSVMNLCIEAEHQGLRTHQMGGFFAGRVREALGIPASQDVLVVIALGKEGRPSGLRGKLSNALYEKLRDRLAKPRTRKDPSENFYFGKWGGK